MPRHDFLGGFPFNVRPIFDVDFGWIYPVGGGTPEEDAAKAKAEADKKAAEEAAKNPALKEAQDKARLAEEALARSNEENAKFRKAEDERKKSAMDDLTRAQTEAKENKEIADKAVQEAKEARLDAAKSRILAKMAQEGKILEAEFVPQIQDEKDMEAALNKAFDRQTEVISKHGKINDEGPNLPPGGQGGKNRPVAAGKWDEFVKARNAYMGGDRSSATEKRIADLRRELAVAGIDPTTGKKKI